MTIGERIRFRRKELSITQTELARRINSTRQTIQKYEKDEVDMPISKLKLVAKGLNTTVFELIQDYLF